MKNSMKLIMENWRNNLSEAEDPIQTVGDFRYLVQSHRAAEAGKEAGKKAVENLVGLVPVLGNVFNTLKGAKDAADVYKKIYGMDDNIRSNTGLDKMNIDDDVSKIIDDPIETAFINDFLGRLSEMADDDPLPDVNEALQDFLKFRFNQHSVEAR